MGVLLYNLLKYGISVHLYYGLNMEMITDAFANGSGCFDLKQGDKITSTQR